MNFECLNCHHKFEADDKMDLTCPHCGSENVRPARKSLSKPLLFTAVFIAAFAIGLFVIKTIKGCDSTIDTDPQKEYSYAGGGTVEDVNEVQVSDEAEILLEEDKTPKNTNIALQEQKIKNEAAKVPVQQPITIVIPTPKADANGTYSFAVKAEHLPADVKVSSFTLTDVGGTKNIAESSTGRFTGVLASADNGEYNLKVDLSNGEIVTRDRIGGFVKVEMVDNRMKAEELTSLLNSKKLNYYNNPRIISDPVIVINNIKTEHDKGVKMIDDIYGKLVFRIWLSITVTSVEYDSHGRVNKFAIDVQHKDEPK